MEFHLDEDALTVSFTPAERLMAMHPGEHLRIPRSSIVSIRIEKDPLRPLSLRFGIDLPFVSLAGWFFRPQAKEFWLHRRSADALCLERVGAPMVRVVVDAPPQGHPIHKLVA